MLYLIFNMWWVLCGGMERERNVNASYYRLCQGKKNSFRLQWKSRHSFSKCHQCSEFPLTTHFCMGKRMDVSVIYTFYIVWMCTPWIFFLCGSCHGLQGLKLKSVSQASANCFHSINNCTWYLYPTKPEEWSRDIWKRELAHWKSSYLWASRRSKYSICLVIQSDYENQETTILVSANAYLTKCEILYPPKEAWREVSSRFPFSQKSFCWLMMCPFLSKSGNP